MKTDSELFRTLWELQANMAYIESKSPALAKMLGFAGKHDEIYEFIKEQQRAEALAILGEKK